MASFHARSNSFPSRPHPVICELDEVMSRLRDSQATSTSSSSIGNKLLALQDLHDCVDKLLLLSITQQVLEQEKNRRQRDEILDESLRILDLCNITKEVLLQTKDSVQQLQSVIRRRQGCLEAEIKKYISSRKIVTKTIKKTLKNLKSNANTSAPSSSETVTMLKEVEAITVFTFESLLSFIGDSKSASKLSGWSLVAKLMHQKRAASTEEQEVNECEYAEVDHAASEALAGSSSVKSNDLQKKLQSLESCIQHLEDGIECLFRRLIKSRASFLNIYN